MTPTKNTLSILFFVVLYSLILVNCEGAGIDIERVITIESSNNPRAYNKKSKARGLCQITPICLKDYNEWTRSTITTNELYIPKINYMIGNYYVNTIIPRYLKNYRLPDTTINRLIAYNWGIKNLRTWWRKGRKLSDLPKETLEYIAKYKTLEAQND